MQKTWRRFALGTTALALSTLVPFGAEAQNRASGVRISRGHVHVGGQHVGAIRATDGRAGLARIVNPAVRRLGPGFGRPADVRAGGFRSSRVGNGRFSDPFGRRLGDRGRLPDGRLPRVGANGILLGGEIPLFLPFFCTACDLGLHPFLSGAPLFPILPVIHVETEARERAPVFVPWPVAEWTSERRRTRPSGPRIGRLVLETPEPEPRKRWDGPCAGVRVRMATGTTHWLRVPLRSLEAETPEAARHLLETRVEEGRPLRLTGFSGGGLTVPARLVEAVEVEACPSEGRP